MSPNRKDALLDTLREVQTPEGIALQLTLAGPVPRALAWAIDALIRAGVYLVLMFALAPLERFGLGLMLILLFAIEWFYPVLFEVLRDGATPGKKAMGLRVLHEDGTPVNWTASVVRNLLRAVDFLPVLYGFGLAAMLLSRDFQRLGDQVAGTVVVHTERERGRAGLPEARPVAPSFPLSQDEQQALLSFAERSTSLTDARAEELAELTGPLVKGSPRPLERVMGMANWIAGRR